MGLCLPERWCWAVRSHLRSTRVACFHQCLAGSPGALQASMRKRSSQAPLRELPPPARLSPEGLAETTWWAQELARLTCRLRGPHVHSVPLVRRVLNVPLCLRRLPCRCQEASRSPACLHESQSYSWILFIC